MTDDDKDSVNVPITLSELVRKWDVFSASTGEYGVEIPFWTYHRVLETVARESK